MWQIKECKDGLLATILSDAGRPNTTEEINNEKGSYVGKEFIAWLLQ